LINAMQAMPTGGNIHISAVSNENTVRIRFDNDGEPIGSENIEKIWEPFFTTKDTGTGLGLGVVKNIVEAHQGDIRIENRSNKGVRVEITLLVR
ncbi:MAG: ATP-binding protein, partial [Thermodesulfobacteriota bacterium]|nr:ATP-binding protein [Thermodesulfobacteriota bacterium]